MSNNETDTEILKQPLSNTNENINNNNNNNINTNVTNSSINQQMSKSISSLSINLDESGSLLVNKTNQQLSASSLNEKVAQLASSIYTELEKIIKLYGRDIVKDLMSIVVNILEALDVAYHEKEELLVENELLKDDYEKLLMQYEREKQSRKDTELKLFQSEDSFAEQKKDYEEKVKSLESIVRMIDLKSKNTSDHVLRLEEKENELKREYNKLHERYTELFKTHCDYLERTKILFGQEGANRLDNSTTSSNSKTNGLKSNGNKNLDDTTSSTNSVNLTNNKNKLFELLKSSGSNINRNDLINCLKNLNKSEINTAVSLFLSQELASSSTQSVSTTDSTLTQPASVTASLTSLNSSNQQNNLIEQTSTKSINDLTIDQVNQVPENCLNDEAKLNLQTSENFDEHLNNCVEFDDTNSDLQSINKNSNLDNEFEGDDEQLAKNDLSLFNELSRENYDITELDDGADLTGMTREVANLIRENSELLQTKHALNVLKDDLIVRLDQFSSEMLILREEIKSLQTVKAALQLRITELEEESKKSKEELAQKTKKLEEEDESIPMSQRKRFTRAEMARVLMERNQYKERLMDLQEAVRWTEMIRASKQDQTSTLTHETTDESAVSNQNAHSSSNEQQSKKRGTLWRIFSDLFGSSSSQPQTTQTNQTHGTTTTITTAGIPSISGIQKPVNQSPKINKTQKLLKQNEQVVPLNDDSIQSITNEQSSANDKIAKAYEFLKEANNNNNNNQTNLLTQTNESKTAPKLINKKELESIREEGRMQAYGWSLPTNKNSSNTNLSLGGVPVPVYCRPLFKEENNLKLSCASSVNLLFSNPNVDLFKTDYEKILKNSTFNSFKSNNDTFKSSCIWICNFNDNDTHISIFDANRPGDLVQQFTLKSLKIHSMLSVSGVTKEDLTEIEIKPIKGQNSSEALVQINKNELNDDLDNITYIEVENENEQVSSSLKSVQSIDKLNANSEESLSTMYPTMWLGSQEGLLLVHSSISNVNQTIDKVKLKDAILCITQIKNKVLVGLADGSLAIFQRSNKTYEWDMKNFYLINFDNSHHSIRCIQNVYENVWSGCRNKIYILNPQNLTVPSVIEVHPRKENQVRHISCINDGVWVSIRLDSTLRLYHAKTHQHLQYLDIEPFITRMLGTSNLGLSLVRISSMTIANKRLWIGTGNGVILSIPFSINSDDSTKAKSVPGQVVRVTSNDEIIPYCNLIDSQFSFHGHRDAVKFFLNVPSEAIQKNVVDKSVKTYEKTETMLLLSGGHGYIDFRIGDSNVEINKGSPIGVSSLSDIKKSDSSTNDSLTSKNDRSHLIVWQMNQN